MFCIHCGNKLKDDDKFCNQCGNKIENSEKNKLIEKEKSSADILYEKYVSIMKAQDEEDQKNRALLSDAIWEMFNRFSVNNFNSLLEEFPEEFNKQPFKAMENLKESIRFFITSATQVWLAERMIRGEIIEAYQLTNEEILAEEWKELFLNFKNNTLFLSSDIEVVLFAIYKQLEEGLFEKNPSLKVLPSLAIKRIKDTLLQQLINGYLLGKAEDNLRAINKK
jgi:hypothetical protein